MASRKVGYGTGVAIGAVLLLGITVFVNRIVADMNIGRFDLTEGKIYTISDGAKNILAQLEVPVQVKYYVTPEGELPAMLNTLPQDVKDKLDELSIASKGRLQYQVVNPTESPELEETLAQKGIRPFQVQSVERDAIGVKLVYSAISIGYKDKPEEILPQVLPETLDNFEYELLSNVLRIVREDQPIVAIYSTREPVDPQMAQFYMQLQQPIPEPTDNFTTIPELLRGEGYDVRPVELTEESNVPDDAQTLLVLAPRNINDRQRYEIHRVLARGGNVIVAAQKLTYSYDPGQRGGFDISVRAQTTGVNDLLGEYGVRVDDRMLMDAQMATLAIPRTQTIGGLRFQMSEPVQAPMQIRVLGEGIRQDVPITAGVPEVLYLWGTQLILDEGGVESSGLAATPLLTGSDKAWVIDRQSGALTSADVNPDNHELLDRPLLGVMLEGVFPDPWEGEDPPAWPGAAADTTDAADDAAADTLAADDTEQAQPGRLLVFGCAKMFEDMLVEQQAHSLFLLNAVDAVTLGNDLISIRSKVYERRTIGETSDAQKLLFRGVNMGLVPIALVGFGLLRWGARRRESDRYAAKRKAQRAGGRS